MDHNIEIDHHTNQPYQPSNVQDSVAAGCADSILAVHQPSSDKGDGADPATATPTPFTAVDQSGGAARSSPSSTNGEKVCRICHLGGDGGDGRRNKDSCMGLIELGCACKDELGTSHYECAHAWFSLKRTRRCEVCGNIAKNIDGIEEMEGRNSIRAQPMEGLSNTATIQHVVSASPVEGHAPQLCVKSTCNFLLTCLILALFLPWVFHFRKPW